MMPEYKQEFAKILRHDFTCIFIGTYLLKYRHKIHTSFVIEIHKPEFKVRSDVFINNSMTRCEFVEWYKTHLLSV